MVNAMYHKWCFFCGDCESMSFFFHCTIYKLIPMEKKTTTNDLLQDTDTFESVIHTISNAYSFHVQNYLRFYAPQYHDKRNKQNAHETCATVNVAHCSSNDANEQQQQDVHKPQNDAKTTSIPTVDMLDKDEQELMNQQIRVCMLKTMPAARLLYHEKPTWFLFLTDCSYNADQKEYVDYMMYIYRLCQEGQLSQDQAYRQFCTSTLEFVQNSSMAPEQKTDSKHE